MSDRLQEIKAQHSRYWYRGHMHDDVTWLLTEIERLREANDVLNGHTVRCRYSTYACEQRRAEVERLRAELVEFRNDCQRFADAFNHALQGRDFDDVFPWTFTPYVEGVGDPDCGGISTPNGPRPDGSMHTYWTVTGETWEPWGRLIVEVVNSAARAIRPAAAVSTEPRGDPQPYTIQDAEDDGDMG